MLSTVRFNQLTYFIVRFNSESLFYFLANEFRAKHRKKYWFAVTMDRSDIFRLMLWTKFNMCIPINHHTKTVFLRVTLKIADIFVELTSINRKCSINKSATVFNWSCKMHGIWLLSSQLSTFVHLMRGGNEKNVQFWKKRLKQYFILDNWVKLILKIIASLQNVENNAVVFFSFEEEFATK